jgi:hypothetical protein
MTTIGRRLLLRGAIGSIGSILGAGCSKKLPASCLDAPGLPPEHAQIRASLAYADSSPEPEKRCVTCRQYVPPPEEGSCGSCKVMQGPVHPNGTCKVYGPKG